jgi:DNA repair exonuclease SbcCD nuclease subunit
LDPVTCAGRELEDGAVRLLVFADVHLDAPFVWAGPRLARIRRRELRDTVSRICALADELQVDALLCAGDLYEHDRVTPDTASFLQASFGELGRPVFLAPGNHDWCGPRSLYSEVRWSSNVHVFATDRLQPAELTPGLTLWGAAHLAPANTDGFLEGFSVDRGGVHVALFHGSERSGLPQQGSGKVPHAPFRAADVPASGLHHVFAGHYHSPADGPWHTYPGNPDPLTFGETGERGAVLAEVATDGTVSRTRRQVGGSAVASLTVDLTGVTHAGEIRDRVAAKLAPMSGVVRVTVSGAVAPEVDVRLDDLTDLGRHLDGLVVRAGDLRVAYNLDALATEPTVRGQFVRDVRADPDLDEHTRQRVLTTGLQALEGRLPELGVG